MRIAVIGAKGIPAFQGGIEHYCQEIYPTMAREGHRVHLFARQRYTQTSQWHYTQRDVRVINLPSVPRGGMDAFFNALLASILCLFGRYEIVHYHALGPAFFCFIPRLFSNARVVVTCHGLDWQREKWDQLSQRFLRWGERLAVHFAHELIVVSPPLHQYFWTTYNRETRYIPTAPAHYAPSDPEFPYVRSMGLQVGRYILFVGRIVPEKRPDLLLKAFQRLRPHGYKLVFVGGTSDTAYFARQLVEQSIEDSQVVFTGELMGARLAEMMRGAGLFVLPSDLEGLPLVLLEAMREGIPVLASNIPPHQYLLGHHHRGWLFEAGNCEDLARCLDQALGNPSQSQLMAQNARHYVKNYHSWEGIVGENLTAYRKARPRRPTRKPSLSQVKS
ncbi:glycosyltransferase family 4 protein [Lyngbya confervoides]|uniref:Glycosyltransferase family 4 protein n=1 Tax=Lyngbya confervoides BDU141951 TaxID=1574623 RepID=A0ABD4T7Y3_9CYAN|nr:glycosyltransferase family 4 protein [Lyngbya confervoides]MCM1984697.1 glycosyltransferase family 4 protein [Lyngbya confervoides BDU141951]